MQRASETPIRARVRHARRGLTTARLAEAAIVGAAAVAFCLAALVASGGELSSEGSWPCAGICALLASATWAGAHRSSALEIARKIDHELAFRGGFLTAWQAEEQPGATPIAQLLSLRMAQRVTGARALRAVLPHSLGIIILPFLAGALFALARDWQEEKSSPVLFGEAMSLLSLEFEDLLADAEPDGVELSAEEQELVRQMALAAARLGEAGPDPDSRSGEKLEELAEEARELRLELPAGGELDRGLDRIEALFDTARVSTGSKDEGGGGEAGAKGESSRWPGVAPGGTDGTMAPRNIPDLPPLTEEFLPEAGLLGVGGWPTEFEGIVARWVEHRRRGVPEPR